MSKLKRIIFLEFPAEVGELDQKDLLRDEETLRICLSPLPAMELEKRGLSYRLPCDFIKTDAVQKNLKNNWEVTDRLTELLGEIAPFGIASYYHLKRMIDSCTEKIVLLDEILSAASADEIVYFSPVPIASSDYQLIFPESRSVFSHLIPKLISRRAPQSKTRIFPAIEPPRPARKLAPKQWLKQRLSSMAKNFFLRGPHKTSDPTLCLVEDGYGFFDLGKRLAADHRIVSWAPWSARSYSPSFGWRYPWEFLKNQRQLQKNRSLFKSKWKALASDPRFCSLFTVRNIDYFPLVSGRLEHLSTEVFAHTEVIYQNAVTYFKEKNVRCVASIFFSRPQTYALAMAARAQGIPVLTVQHSAYGYWDWPIAKYFDGIMSNYRMVGGEGVVEYVNAVENSGCIPIPTGMMIFDKLTAINGENTPEKNERRTIVYPLTPYSKNCIHFSNTRLTLTEYFEINRGILRVLGRFPDIDVIVRPHPAAAFQHEVVALKQWVKQQGWKHIRVSSEGRTLDDMKKADLIVIDSAMTTLLEAAATRAKILVCNRVLPMTETGLNALRKRALYEEDLERFLQVLEKTLVAKDFDNRGFENDEFLRQYATFQHDGNCKTRIQAILKDLLVGRKVETPLVKV